jgi:hypothetical protein
MKVKQYYNKEILNSEQIEWLTSKDTLDEMSHLSLKKRAMIMKEKFGIEKFTSATLRNYCVRYGVNFTKPDYKYYRTLAEDQELKERQLIFVKQLT